MREDLVPGFLDGVDIAEIPGRNAFECLFDISG